MERIVQLLAERANDLQDHLESLLDLDQWSGKPRPIFECKTDLSGLANLHFMQAQVDDLFVQILAQLVPYFESGLLLYRKQQSSRSESWGHAVAFYEGGYFPIAQQHLYKAIELPILKKFAMKKCSPYQLLSPLGLNEIADHADCTAFMCKVHDQFALVLNSKLPEPWLKIHMQTVHQFIQRILKENNL